MYMYLQPPCTCIYKFRYMYQQPPCTCIYNLHVHVPTISMYMYLQVSLHVSYFITGNYYYCYKFIIIHSNHKH